VEVAGAVGWEAQDVEPARSAYEQLAGRTVNQGASGFVELLTTRTTSAASRRP